jgi:DNA replication regulator DPB11
LYLAEHNAAAREQYRTECWLERCLFVDRVCAPDEHASFVPLGVPLPVPGADLITLSFSGLDVSVACWVRRLLKALGAFRSFCFVYIRQCLC